MVHNVSLLRVCLISPGHVASNPRLVKEADALTSAGYRVNVVAGDYMAAVQSLDSALLSTVLWKCTQVSLGTRSGYRLRRLRQEVSRYIARRGFLSPLLATWAHSPISYRLGKVAARKPADLYIAHCLAALPAAAYAASVHNAKLGFDAEDFHVGELLNVPENQADIAVRDCIERTFLPRCHHLTASSPKISEFYADRYGVKMQTILNVFPALVHNQEMSSVGQTSSSLENSERRLFSLYWFSQTVGPGRGLEAVIQSLEHVGDCVQLSLRGMISSAYKEALQQLAKSLGLKDRLVFLPSAPPGEMTALASKHDVGLSLELPTPINRDICLTNKIFTYLSAGLPVLLSRTTAQTELATVLGQAAVLIDVDDPKSIAAAINSFLTRPSQLARSKIAAEGLARSRYNWSIEQKTFLASVEQVLN